MQMQPQPDIFQSTQAARLKTLTDALSQREFDNTPRSFNSIDPGGYIARQREMANNNFVDPSGALAMSLAGRGGRWHMNQPINAVTMDEVEMPEVQMPKVDMRLGKALGGIKGGR